MRKMLVLGVALLPTLVFGELDKKQAGLLKRVSQGIDDRSTALEKVKDFNDRVKGDYERRVGKLVEQLGELPAGDAEVVATRTKLEALQKLLASKSAALGATQQAASDLASQVDALLAAPDFEADQNELSAMWETWTNSSILGFTGYWVARDASEELNQRDLRAAQSLATVQQRYEALCAKYAPTVALKKPPAGKTAEWADVRNKVGDEGREKLKAFVAKAADYAKKAPGYIETELARAKKDIDAAIAAGEHAKLSGATGDLQTTVGRCETVLANWTALAPAAPEHDKLAALVSGVRAHLDAGLEKVSGAIVAANRPTAEAYKGADRGALEAYVRERWAKEYPKDQVLLVRFTEEAFTRRTAMEWDQSRSSWEKVDESSLRVQLVIATANAAEAMFAPAVVLKLHLKGDSLGLREGRTSNPRPMQRMLRKNL